ncbi:MAG: decarboxylating 6-phosphogluconate dehydrogenase [Gammaproteobacteria bacterium]|nr:decarboxylating 6-phosphogluconate dehydrogenase [Gammaproteobacteria bacterium]
MQIGMIGLGRMGANMMRRLANDGHDCVGHDLNPDNVATMKAEGFPASADLNEFLSLLDVPRAVWLMVPHGKPTEASIAALAERLAPDDVVIDGGNSHYKDDVRHAARLAEQGVHYLDVGTSGGVWGLERGYCLMIGGERPIYDRLESVFRSLAPGQGDIARTPARSGEPGPAEQGYLYCGPSGAGHFVKMIHNGIEYGLMQAYAEGFDILRNAQSEALPANLRYDLNLPDIAEVWRRGSVVGSWLLDLSANALQQEPGLESFSGFVQDSGEGRWTIQAAIDEAVPADVLTAALYTRFRSRQDHTFAEKLLSAMRKQFGGHTEPK